ncbi:MAG: amidohydrolase family protein [Candidatus Polarisedimenticolia bacterium]
MTGPLVFRGVTVIDMVGARPKSGMTVVISGGRILDVGRTQRVRFPKDARVVDARGKFLIPGLWDMHWHLHAERETRHVHFPLMIANGVTGVRDMFTDCMKNCAVGVNIKVVRKWRRQFAAGRLTAPRLLASSQILDGVKPTQVWFYPVADARAARRAVRTFKARGCDFIKVYSLLSRAAYFAIADEAKRQRIPFAGHIPIDVTASEASRAGQRSIEHLDFISSFSAREAELMKELVLEIERITCTPYFTALVYCALDANLVRAADSLDRRKLARVSRIFVRNRTWFCPTLAYHHADAFHDRKEYARDPRLKYVPRTLQAEWAELKSARVSMPQRMAEMKRIFPTHLKIIGAMHRAGVKLLAGTDATQIHVVPGFSLHDELALLAEAGLTPLEALQAATIAPARFMEREKDLGTIEAGKLADLVLLEANPLDDIRHTRRIAAVVSDGRYFSKGALKGLLASASRSARKRKRLK